jgi:hypothetical protein
VVALAGFSWGFDVDRLGAIRVRPVGSLGAPDWTEQLTVLRRTYPTWGFEPGFGSA